MIKKEKNTMFANLPQSAAEFIKLVIKKMRYRKKVRNEVMAELAAHFEDELRDCKTEQEKEQKAQQLITDFGDAKLLAVLLRRAKKRCRPLWRTIVARSFQTIGILILCLIIYIVWFLTGKPKVTIDYTAELNKFVTPKTDKNLNAAPFYIQAAEIIEKLSKEKTNLLYKKYDNATSEEKQMIRNLIEENTKALDLVREGSKKPYYWVTYETTKDNGVMGVLMPHLSGYRQLARTLRWKTLLDAEKGDYKNAFDDTLTCYKLGKHLHGISLIEQLVEIAVKALSVQTIRDILSNYTIDSQILASLQRDYENLLSDDNLKTINLEMEKMCMYDEIQRCFTEDKFGGGHIYLSGILNILPLIKAEPYLFNIQDVPKILHILFTHPDKEETKQMADRYYSFWEETAQKTPAQVYTENIDIEKQTKQLIKGNILLEILAPAMSKVIEISYRCKVDSEATLVIIAVLRYKLETGQFPITLQQLVEKNYLRQLPIDPWSDKPLVYRKTEENFILYSVGTNFIDDGGKIVLDEGANKRIWNKEGDWVFWPVEK